MVYIVSYYTSIEEAEDDIGETETKSVAPSAASIYRQEPANTLVYFPILEANNIPTSHTHLRVDWGSAQVCVIDYGWVSASDPAGAWEIR